jgi:L-threonylcarbamoyladenylate synthase
MPVQPDSALQASPEVARAVELLRAGELVAFPTETVYGLGADASNPEAVARIFAAKGRPADHPLIVHLPSAAALDTWAREVPEAARKLAAAFWPGPLTLILKRQPHVLDAVTGGQDTVGLRVPNHPLALALLHAFNGAQFRGLAAPSANRYGRISPTSAAHVRAELGAAVPLVLDGGACAVGIESTIVDLSSETPRVLRPGVITAVDLARVLGETPSNRKTEGITPRVAGSHAAHYAPRTPLRLVAGEQLSDTLRAELNTGLRIAVLAHTATPVIAKDLAWHAAPADPTAYAHDLYATLRALDAAGYDLLLVEAPPEASAWLAVADRLERAACGSGEDDET